MITGWIKRNPAGNIIQSDFFERIHQLIPAAGNYLCYFFVSKYYEYIKPLFPNNFQNRWYVEEYPKSVLNQEIMDIDSTLTGRIASLIEMYSDQIHSFYLGSGDIDLHYVVDIARDKLCVNQEIMDIDSTLTGRIASLIEMYSDGSFLSRKRGY